MKQTKTKLLCLLFAVLMLLSLTACGKDKETDPGVIKLGDYELLYKGACIMEDANGKDAIVMTLDFTNNSKENASYLWTCLLYTSCREHDFPEGASVGRIHRRCHPYQQRVWWSRRCREPVQGRTSFFPSAYRSRCV